MISDISRYLGKKIGSLFHIQGCIYKLMFVRLQATAAKLAGGMIHVVCCGKVHLAVVLMHS